MNDGVHGPNTKHVFGFATSLLVTRVFSLVAGSGAKSGKLTETTNIITDIIVSIVNENLANKFLYNREVLKSRIKGRGLTPRTYIASDA